MPAFLAFTTEAMKLLEEEQYLQLKKKEKDPLKPKQPMSAFLMLKNERRAALLVESKGVWEVVEIMGEKWNNITKKQKKPYEKVQLTLSLSAAAISYFGNLQIAKAKQGKVFGRNGGLQAEEGGRVCQSQKKKRKQEALQLPKKKEKTNNII